MSIRPVTEYPMLPSPGGISPERLAAHQGFMTAVLTRHFGELGFAINRLINRTRFGALADRPDPAEANRFFFATDTKEMYYDDGSAWSLVVASPDAHTHPLSEITDSGTAAAEDTGKTIGDVPQYEDDGAGNPVLDHPNVPHVGGVPVLKALSNRPIFSAWKGSASGGSVSGIVKPYEHVEVNQGSHLDASTGRFTAPVAGLYKIEFVAFTQSGSGDDGVQVLKNGVEFSANIRSIDRSSDTNYHGSLVINVILQLAAGDYIEINVYQGAIHDNANAFFSGYLFN